MRKGRRLVALLFSAVTVVSMVGTGVPAGASAATQGVWSAPFSPFGLYDAAPPATVEESKQFPAAASAVVMPTGGNSVDIVYWNGLQDLEDAEVHLLLEGGAIAGQSQVKRLTLDVSAAPGSAGSPAFLGEDGGAATLAYEGDDLFCSDQRLLADGRVLVAGGTFWTTEFPAGPVTGDEPVKTAELYGSKQTHILEDYEWSLGQDMQAPGRWYPTVLTLGNGKLFMTGGVHKLIFNTKGFNETQSEIWDPATGEWSKIGTDSPTGSMGLYPRLHLLPNGEIFYGGAAQNWGPAGETLDQAVWNVQRVFNTGTGTWRTTGVPAYGARSGAFSVLLPLTAPYESADVLIAGGVLGTSPGAYAATPLTEIVTVERLADTGNLVSVSRPAAPLNNPRWFSTGVLLPNGHVLALNGAQTDEVVLGGYEPPVRQAELWNGSAWVALSSGARDRTYHNSAVLLPDGSVLVGGHAPINSGYGKPTGDQDGDPNFDGPFAQNFKDPSFERFYPPYLFEADGSPAVRPAITAAPSAAEHGDAITVGTSGQVSKMVLVRHPSQTHTTDADMRAIELAKNPNGTWAIPANGAVAPPGWYYLFALDADGTPSVARSIVVNLDSE